MHEVELRRGELMLLNFTRKYEKRMLGGFKTYSS
jgi:hypothetical protein